LPDIGYSGVLIYCRQRVGRQDRCPGAAESR